MPTDNYDDTTAMIARTAQAVLDGASLDHAAAARLAAVQGESLIDLFYWANKIRIRFVGHAVRFCSIVAAKVGNCSEDCAYCSQSAHFTTGIDTSKMTVDQMQTAAAEAVENGASSFGIVNAGRGPTESELDWLEPFFETASKEGRIRPCATLGELNESQAHRLRDMGVLRVNHNLETSRRHFPNVVTTHTYDDRVRTIRTAKAAGLSICSGGIFGMGEHWDDRIDMALTLRELGADVVPINFLNRIDGTPLHGRCEDLSPMEALKIIAVYRFLLPDRELKVAGGREKILRDLQSWIFMAGASSFLIGNYLTTYGRTPDHDHQMLRDLEQPYLTFDEVEHEAPTTTAGVPSQTGAGVALPVVQS